MRLDFNESHPAWRKLAAMFSLAMIYFSPVTAETWEAILDTIRKKFPFVRQITPEQLVRWLGDESRPAPVLVDVRGEEEFLVSHLRGAANLRSVRAVEAHLSDRSQAIVVYCSIGYRSSALADQLRKAGWTNVINLEGSIFAWANAGLPLYRGEQMLQPPEVHPYNRKWGKLLQPHLR